jgi:dephospho-CoA kinase
MTLHLGITGGIGSGKSTVCHIFSTLGIPIYYADERAKWLMTHDLDLIKGIKTLFGEEAYLKDGSLNRKLISAQAFGQPALLAQLNALVHPAVGKDGLKWQAEQSSPYTLKEAALMYESGSHKTLDKIIVVTAPLELRIARVMARDQVEREAVEKRIAQQMPEEEKIKRADYLIHNDGEHSLVQQVYAIHQQVLALTL